MPSQAKREVLQAYRNHHQWMVEKNIEKLNQSLAPEFFLKHMSGLKQEKAVWLNEIATGSMTYLASDEEQIEIQIENNHAEVIGRNKVEAIIHGSHGTWRLQLNMPLEKINGEWMIMNAVASMY